MKASELIKRLEQLKEEHGDLDVEFLEESSLPKPFDNSKTHNFAIVALETTIDKEGNKPKEKFLLC